MRLDNISGVLELNVCGYTDPYAKQSLLTLNPLFFILFCRLYQKLFKKAYGAPSGDEMIRDMAARLEHYNEEQGQECAKMTVTEENQLVIAICTPVMKRIHEKIRQSGEMVFIDSTGNCDRQNHRIFLLLTHRKGAGG